MIALAVLAAAPSAQEVSLFPFGDYWWFYAGFLVMVGVLLALDLGVFHRTAHDVSIREASLWTLVWISLAVVFNVGLYLWLQHRLPLDERLMAIPGFDPAAAARKTALEFLAGYVMEKALSVDNIFVFVIVLDYFRIPTKYQHRVLFFGVLGALLFRAAFIALGAVLIKYQEVVFFFGVFLIFTGIKMMFASGTGVKPQDNALLRLFRKYMPVTNELHEQRFFVAIEGVRHATPLFVALLFLEMTDIVFAVDSVPAIYAITSEPLIVFTSNIFAILGLRSLYFVFRRAVDKFHLLKYGLGVVLIFVGCKMTFLGRFFESGHFPIEWSLLIILGVLALSTAASLMFPPPPGAEREANVPMPLGTELFFERKEPGPPPEGKEK